MGTVSFGVLMSDMVVHGVLGMIESFPKSKDVWNQCPRIQLISRLT